ncbi:phage tail assembly chaperone [Pseudomonas sp. GM60]|jgi:hypothetical protein|uniref:phage tail assembly chaperone n=1 Tax=Pseudomonas sp. GM60 TaxID=1144334 RepID=UPI000270965B|nr:phage tail assembly chaperone [Pseudomonas sp. GM60]EJM81388.1 hypothetical protein PMI32_03156 [Pseudomonas sp. GM60]
MGKYLVLNSEREVITQLIEGVHDIPSNAVLIDNERWYEVTQDISCDWQMSEAGELIKRPKLPPTDGQLPGAFEREWRDQVLQSTEWLVSRQRDEQEMARQATLTAEQFAALLAYRQGLRDWPQSSDFPDVQHRPKPPAWIADQTQ